MEQHKLIPPNPVAELDGVPLSDELISYLWDGRKYCSHCACPLFGEYVEFIAMGAVAHSRAPMHHISCGKIHSKSTKPGYDFYMSVALAGIDSRGVTVQEETANLANDDDAAAAAAAAAAAGSNQPAESERDQEIDEMVEAAAAAISAGVDIHDVSNANANNGAEAGVAVVVHADDDVDDADEDDEDEDDEDENEDGEIGVDDDGDGDGNGSGEDEVAGASGQFKASSSWMVQNL